MSGCSWTRSSRLSASTSRRRLGDHLPPARQCGPCEENVESAVRRPSKNVQQPGGSTTGQIGRPAARHLSIAHVGSAASLSIASVAGLGVSSWLLPGVPVRHETCVASTREWRPRAEQHTRQHRRAANVGGAVQLQRASPSAVQRGARSRCPSRAAFRASSARWAAGPAARGPDRRKTIGPSTTRAAGSAGASRGRREARPVCPTVAARPSRWK